MNVTIIGFGEAGPVFGKQLSAKGFSVSAWDKRQTDSSTESQQISKTKSLGITPCNSMLEAVGSADLIISTVTASQALVAAEEAANGLREGCQWLDLNSVSPITKKAIHDVVSAKGVSFTEGVAMDTVPAKGIEVPILLCGPESQSLSQLLNDLGLNTRSVSTELGAASTTKLLRSILIKGMEALFAESMEAAGKVGVQDEVIASLQATYPELNWQETAAYQLSRATLHATRRASEMREAQNLVEQLGVEPIMAEAIAKRQQDLSDRDVASNYNCGISPSISAYLEALNKSLPS
jgi:3-hydroxyisobutyrate dehydrogenase-like beta-hydroxyacid dehydrogenase